MAIALAQYLAEASRRDSDKGSIEQCIVCGVPLQEAINGYRKVGGGTGAECSDCYFSDISDLIDKHPIGKPISRFAHA
jgi:hypothetical protein